MLILYTSSVDRSIVASSVCLWGAIIIIVSPGSEIMAIRCCPMVELDNVMVPGPEGLIGTMVRVMDAVFVIYAVGNNGRGAAG